MGLTALIFDMDDTLYPEKDYVASGFQAVGRYVERTLGHSGFAAAALRLFQAGEKRQVFNRALAELGLPCTGELIAELVACYRRHEPQIALAADAKAVLSLVGSGVKLGLLSDGYLEAQERKVHKLGLPGRFDAVVLSDELGRACWKPSPVPYERITQLLAVDHEACVYVGDNGGKDFITAKALGWRTVRLRRADGVYADAPVPEAYEAHYQIDNLLALPSIEELKPLFARGGIRE